MLTLLILSQVMTLIRKSKAAQGKKVVFVHAEAVV
jgi:hypothetical protein